MKKYIFGILLAVMIVPQAASAFSVSDTKVTKFGDRVALFQIDYDLGYKKYGMEAPAKAVRENPVDLQLAYSVRREDGEVSGLGYAASLISSAANLQDGYYQSNPGESETYSLYVLWMVPEGEEVHDYYLQVDRLPFNIIDGETKVKNGLSGGELKSFVAKRLVLKLSN